MTQAIKLRLRFAKSGTLRLVSHHDMMRCLERLVRRARIPLAMSQGFTPRPKIVFAMALGLGIEARNEVVDMELSQPSEPADILRRLAESSPRGLEWVDAQPLPSSTPAPRPLAVEYRLPVPTTRLAQARASLEALLASSTHLVTRRRPDRHREFTFDLRPFLLSAELTDDGFLTARLMVGPDGSARPEELLESLWLRDLLDQGAVLVRSNMELAPG
jgi:radical SAM-linked protein